MTFQFTVGCSIIFVDYIVYIVQLIHVYGLTQQVAEWYSCTAILEGI